MREVERFVEKCGEWIARMQGRFSTLPKTSRVESSKKEYRKYKNTARDEVAHLSVAFQFLLTIPLQ